jgi:proteasome lid subunit RPN8/RPN11
VSWTAMCSTRCSTKVVGWFSSSAKPATLSGVDVALCLLAPGDVHVGRGGDPVLGAPPQPLGASGDRVAATF